VNKILALLVGPQGSGKTTYSRTHLTEYCRISQDDQGRHGHFKAFEQAIRQGRPRIVIDRTNAVKFQRKRYLDLARAHGYMTRIIWFNEERDVCLRRCQKRIAHSTVPWDRAEKAIRWFYRYFRMPSRREADSLEIIGRPPDYAPVRDLTGPIGKRRHLIVGDIHGCLDELLDLLKKQQFDRNRDVLISVGDIVDRGPKIKETVEFVFALPQFYMVRGNHDDKLCRYLEGPGIRISGGLQSTIIAYDGEFPPGMKNLLGSLPFIVKIPSGNVVHAGFDPEQPLEEQLPEDCLYMRYYGGKDYLDADDGQLWYTVWPSDGPRVFFGHIPEARPFAPNVIALDGGCVFGGELRAFDSRDGRVHSVKARRTYAIRGVRPFIPAAKAG
jgi:serine/threonine protein phosphatase 1